ncbi:hypothetical protein [Flavobacterium gawalongense]|uniref:hypothetical protein n=1 Tax=Flavobacterium gawalongense TaxID=2594432 RepID=UPI001F3DFED7|nr:hypothetical protein [Flavobacterium gawalongense]
MDLQSRKINFVQEFLSIQSEEVVSRLEKFLKKEKEKEKFVEAEKLQPMTIEDFNKRIDQSMEDSKNNRI